MAKDKSEKEKKDKKEKKEKRRSEEDGISKPSKDKKEKKEKKAALAAAVAQSDVVTEKLVDALENGENDDVKATTTLVVPLGALVPFANPLADEKVAKKVLKNVKKGVCPQYSQGTVVRAIHWS